MIIVPAVLELGELNEMHIKLLEGTYGTSAAGVSSCCLRSEGTVTEAIKPKPVGLLFSTGRSFLRSYIVREDFRT